MNRRERRTMASAFVVALLFAVAPRADAATRYVTDTGADGPGCGLALTSACRSISQAIALAGVGDTVLVGPGRYGDLNDNGILGEPGEEFGAPGCGCVLAVNKAVTLVSSGGAAVTWIDARAVNAIQNVLLIGCSGSLARASPLEGSSAASASRSTRTTSQSGEIGSSACSASTTTARGSSRSMTPPSLLKGMR